MIEGRQSARLEVRGRYGHTILFDQSRRIPLDSLHLDHLPSAHGVVADQSKDRPRLMAFEKLYSHSRTQQVAVSVHCTLGFDRAVRYMNCSRLCKKCVI